MNVSTNHHWEQSRRTKKRLNLIPKCAHEQLWSEHLNWTRENSVLTIPTSFSPLETSKINPKLWPNLTFVNSALLYFPSSSNIVPWTKKASDCIDIFSMILKWAICHRVYEIPLVIRRSIYCFEHSFIKAPTITTYQFYSYVVPNSHWLPFMPQAYGLKR